MQPDQTFGPASLRDAVANEAYPFAVCVVCDGEPIVRYYAKTREIADSAVKLLETIGVIVGCLDEKMTLPV